LFDCFAQSPDHRPKSAHTIAKGLIEIYEASLEREFPLPEPQELELPAGTLNNRGLSLLEIKKDEDARRVLRSAFDDHPESVELAYNTALIDWRNAEISGREAFQPVSSVYQNFPRRWLPSFALGLLCAEEWDFENAQD